jgi:hypothetical protein
MKMAALCESGNELSGLIKLGNSLIIFNNDQLFRKTTVIKSAVKANDGRFSLGDLFHYGYELQKTTQFMTLLL